MSFTPTRVGTGSSVCSEWALPAGPQLPSLEWPPDRGGQAGSLLSQGLGLRSRGASPSGERVRGRQRRAAGRLLPVPQVLRASLQGGGPGPRCMRQKGLRKPPAASPTPDARLPSRGPCLSLRPPRVSQIRMKGVPPSAVTACGHQAQATGNTHAGKPTSTPPPRGLLSLPSCGTPRPVAMTTQRALRGSRSCLHGPSAHQWGVFGKQVASVLKMHQLFFLVNSPQPKQQSHRSQTICIVSGTAGHREVVPSTREDGHRRASASQCL